MMKNAKNILLIVLTLYLFSSTLFAQPDHSYQISHHWQCYNGYKKINNECIPIKVPMNAWVKGDQWYCYNGYQRSGEHCIPIKAPMNAWVKGDQWYCYNGYQRSGEHCIPINKPL